MNTLRALLLLSLAMGLLQGCGGSDPMTAPNDAAPQNHQQDPVVTGSLLEELIKRRKDDAPIFVADGTRRPESEALGAIKSELKRREIPFSDPKWRNYQYFLNRMIPLTRLKGSLWLVFDHRMQKLTKVLREGYLDYHKIAFEHEFENATLVLTTNEFRDEGPQRFGFETVLGRGGITTNIAFTPDDEFMFATGNDGRVRWASRTSEQKGTMLKLPRAGNGTAGLFASGESGFLGLALHPDYANNHKAYLNYNWRDQSGKRSAILSEWLVDTSKAPGAMTLTNERRLLELDQEHDNHNAGCIKFGADGFLYISVGDGEQGKWTIGRSPAHTLRGKVLRIDVDKQDEGKQYAVPPDNPFVGDAGFPAETWAWGFRNPWRLALLPDGRMIASDIGEDVNEELTFVVKGKHHGWPYYEGSHTRNPWTLDAPLQPPLLPYGRLHGMSVIAGDIYEGSALPELVDKFVFADYLSGRLWAFELPDTNTTLQIEDCEQLVRWPLQFATITKAPDGELYFGAHTGEVLKLVRGNASNVAATGQPTKADPELARGMYGTPFSGKTPPASTPAQIAFGKRLFSDERLSANGKSCASCHDLARFGQDGKSHAALGGGPRRNTPSLFHVQQQFGQFRDYRCYSVEEAVIESLTCHMGHTTPVDALAAVTKVEGAAEAFPGKALTVQDIASAVAAFLRQLEAPSRWSRFLDGDDKALTDAELIGLNEFSNAGCATCHMYRGLGGGMPQKLGLMELWEGEDKGRGEIDKTPGQEFFFKVPTLYHVAKTAPYYHDGRFKTLAEAVSNMARIQLGRKLTKAQVASIVTFLHALDGELPKVIR